MASRIAEWFEAALHTDRFDRWFRGGIVAFVAALFALPLVVLVGTVWVGTAEHQSLDADTWFERVVHVDHERFANIQHFTLQGIDVSHHFRFEYSDPSDIELLIGIHDLVRDANPLPESKHAPNWYRPQEILTAPNCRSFVNHSAASVCMLIVDDQKMIGYFEFGGT